MDRLNGKREKMGNSIWLWGKNKFREAFCLSEKKNDKSEEFVFLFDSMEWVWVGRGPRDGEGGEGDKYVEWNKNVK